MLAEFFIVGFGVSAFSMERSFRHYNFNFRSWPIAAVPNGRDRGVRKLHSRDPWKAFRMSAPGRNRAFPLLI